MPPVATADDDWRGSGLVLLVDDEEPVRRFTVGLLVELGFTVIQATDGPQAIDVVRDRHDELAAVLLDHTMPEMGADAVLSELESEGVQVPIVLTSGHDIYELKQLFTDHTVASFLQKPYGLRTMRSALRDAITSHTTDQSA